MLASLRKISSVQLVIAAFAVLAVFQTFFGEKITVNGGLGWDGQRYAVIIRDMDYMLAHEQMDNYHLNRISMLLLVNKSLKWGDIPVTHHSVIWAFSLFNLLFYLLSLLLAAKIAQKSGFDSITQALFLLLIFGSFHQTKLVFFYPVLTDCLAWFYCLLFLFLWISNHRFLLLLAILLSFFVYPVIPFLGILLFCFGTESVSQSKPLQFNFISYAVIAVTLVAAAILAGYLSYVYLPKILNLQINMSTFVQEVVLTRTLNIFALLMVQALFSLVLAKCFLEGIKSNWRSLFFVLFQLALFAFLYSEIKTIGYRIAPTVSKYSFDNHLNYGFLNSSHLLLKNWVAHFQYFGLAMIIPFLILYKALREWTEVPTALLLIVGLFGLQSIDTESRHLFMYIPFLAMDGIQYINVKSKTDLLILAATTLYFSKCWTFIGPMTESRAIPFGEWQRYFRFHGNWMDEYSYAIALFNLILMVIGVGLWGRRKKIINAFSQS